jgi:methylated-DNA-[protein]-cysteine S-methyltransferase
MRIFTKRAERYAALGPVSEEYYVTELGVGTVLVAGDVPVELELPEADAAAPPSCPASRWTLALERYFAGERVTFDLDVDAYAGAHGLTAFEREVYRALAVVPYGTALSYRDLATAAGHPNAYRAVGSAMARNALPVILPCHRVVKNDGRLGYYGDDPAWKARLLRLEGVGVDGDRLTAAGDRHTTAGDRPAAADRFARAAS